MGGVKLRLNGGVGVSEDDSHRGTFGERSTDFGGLPSHAAIEDELCIDDVIRRNEVVDVQVKRAS